MINLHSHSLFSDGVLILSELACRAEAKGYEALAITDHTDMSNIENFLPRLAGEEGANLIFGIDSHEPVDLVTLEEAKKILRGAGLNDKEIAAAFENARRLVEKVVS